MTAVCGYCCASFTAWHPGTRYCSRGHRRRARLVNEWAARRVGRKTA